MWLNAAAVRPMCCKLLCGAMIWTVTSFQLLLQRPGSQKLLPGWPSDCTNCNCCSPYAGTSVNLISPAATWIKPGVRQRQRFHMLQECGEQSQCALTEKVRKLATY